MQDLVGKVAVITGAGSGIGRALALRCGAEGMAVVAASAVVVSLCTTRLRFVPPKASSEAGTGTDMVGKGAM